MVEQWTPGPGPYKTQLGRFEVIGVRYTNDKGEVGWHIMSCPNQNPIHDYWVVDSDFRGIATHIFDPAAGGKNTMTIWELDEPVEATEGAAILGAIAKWETDIAIRESVAKST